jgi:hypothetical protein
MAKFSKKVMGKEIGDATVYAKPHTMDGKPMQPKNQMAGVKTTGIETRGNGAATKGRIARGPMA